MRNIAVILLLLAYLADPGYTFVVSGLSPTSVDWRGGVRITVLGQGFLFGVPTEILVRTRVHYRASGASLLLAG